MARKNKNKNKNQSKTQNGDTNQSKTQNENKNQSKTQNENKNQSKNRNKKKKVNDNEVVAAHLRFGEMTPVSASRRVPRAAPATPTTSPTAQTMLSTQRHHNTTPNPLMFGSISPVSTRATNNTPATEPEASSSTMAPQGPAQVHPPATMSPEIEAAIEAMSNLFTSEQWHLLPNLDDPGLVGKILSRRLGPPGTCSVAFSALPQHDPDGFSADFGRFGTVLIESHQKLAIRMKHCTMDLLNFVRQVWVSKYLTPFHPCSITFDLPDSTGFCNVVMQRVNPPPFNETAALNGNMARLSVVAEEDEYGGSSTMPTPMPATNPSPIFRAGSGPVNDDDFVDNNDVMTWPCRSPVPKDDEDEKSDGEDESARAIRGRGGRPRACSLPNEKELSGMVENNMSDDEQDCLDMDDMSTD